MNRYFYFRKRPSFLIGIARILDITVSLSSYKKFDESNSESEDFCTIYNDWKAVGDDIRDAIGSTFMLTK